MQVSRPSTSIAAGWILVVLSLLACESGHGTPQRSPDSIVAERIDRTIRDVMADQQVPGAAVAVVFEGKTILARGYGLADVENEVPVTAETMFESASVGKMFTAAGVLLLAEEGRLSLSGELSQFIPEAPAAWKGVTIRSLLSHTSGLPDDLYDERLDDCCRAYTEEELVPVMLAMSLVSAPGARFLYSNAGYVLLGIVIRRVTGDFYADYLARRVFSPTGMTTARPVSATDIVPHRASGYDLADGRLVNVSPAVNTTADGSLLLSLRDLLAWDRTVRSRGVLSDASWTAMHKPEPLATGGQAPYGLGWEYAMRGGAELWYHSGAWKGFKAHYARFVGRDLSVLILMNGAHGHSGHFRDAIAEAVDPGLRRRG